MGSNAMTVLIGKGSPHQKRVSGSRRNVGRASIFGDTQCAWGGGRIGAKKEVRLKLRAKDRNYNAGESLHAAA